MGFIPVWAILLRDGLSDPSESLPTWNILWFLWLWLLLTADLSRRPSSAWCCQLPPCSEQSNLQQWPTTDISAWPWKKQLESPCWSTHWNPTWKRDGCAMQLAQRFTIILSFVLLQTRWHWWDTNASTGTKCTEWALRVLPECCLVLCFRQPHQLEVVCSCHLLGTGHQQFGRGWGFKRSSWRASLLPAACLAEAQCSSTHGVAVVASGRRGHQQRN